MNDIKIENAEIVVGGSSRHGAGACAAAPLEGLVRALAVELAPLCVNALSFMSKGCVGWSDQLEFSTAASIRERDGSCTRLASSGLPATRPARSTEDS